MIRQAFLPILLLLAVLKAGGASAGESFAPDEFSFSGGTGRVTITCTRLEEKDEETWAEIVFNSPHYICVRVDGAEYGTSSDEKTSSAFIPVRVNAVTEITAVTTAMSAPHEIAYSLYIRVEAPGETHEELPGLVYKSTDELTYAVCFSIDRYDDGYTLIRVGNSARYLIVPEGRPVPDGVNPRIVILRQPLSHIYLAATSAMALFDSLDALDAVRLSGTQKDGWYVKNAAEAMAREEMLFAGKYSEPDFELLLREECDLAIESTMISHSPKVQEMLELLGIPVLIDRSSYEPHPLGRVEWIKLYGALLGKEDAANAVFARQARIAEELEGLENTGKTVAFFYINSMGMAVVRSSSDYVPRMIELAGGQYAFGSLPDSDSSHASVGITMETFFDAAVDADFLVYNAAIDSPPRSIRELLDKSPLLSECKAVRLGNVWCADKSLYQATDRLGDLILAFHRMLCGEEETPGFLYRLSGQE